MSDLSPESNDRFFSANERASVAQVRRPTVTPTGPAEERGRASLTLICDARQGLQPWSRIRLEDLSEGGFRLVWPGHQLDRNQPMRLRVPGMELMSAQIRWIQGGVVGCAFATPLHVAVFEHLVKTARAQQGR